ncbi:MAG: hypothetical protein COY69_03225 [Candidatus Magasanikbacteria bacterium CG_4_10_14_0_8_um_filter_32_14]|uniref:Uncharacterized protein n=2 Tax=Candidatus Magasanikiibacteriota TaxID=1752731 RepID=A0A2M7R9U9_9BACT|nr:MAG: hypothetical protein AUJ23_03845 [Candidatus Magasanikbacteria bacterium CG1_02_32_51]PIY93136.1 MAG: hypothetical protein COY69_03225 [Candidatus Magasanikbacteria bacterium CG_4_10_14_0_8_um_filter_32_14]
MNQENFDPRELASASDDIKKMFDIDQTARKNNNPEITIKIDQENTVKLKSIIERIGWPTKSKVGEQSAHYAWLLVQHADQDIEFQKYCLESMKKEPTNEVLQEDIAYLEDRILVAENQPQLYGTQFVIAKDETYGPEEIFEPENLNNRRAEMSMEPFEEYAETMREMYETWKINNKKSSS